MDDTAAQIGATPDTTGGQNCKARGQSMRSLTAATVIMAVLVLSTLVVAISIGSMLYASAVRQNEINMLHIARTTSKLIGAVAAFDRLYSDGDHPDGAAAATLQQVESALGDSVNLGKTGKILVVARQDDAIGILIHQFTELSEGLHSEPVKPGNQYHAVFDRALNGSSGVTHIMDAFDHRLTVAYAPVAGTQWAVAVERHLWEIRQPFVDAAILGALITLVAVILGGLVNYRAAVSISRRANAAQLVAEEALDRTETTAQRLKEALDISNEGFALFDKDDRLVVCNEVFRELYSTHAFAIEPGRTMEDFLRDGIASGAFPQAVGREEEWIRERLAQHQATETVEQQLSDGRWLKITEKRTRDGGIIGVRMDITDIKEREAALKESEQRYKDFTETASDWVWETDSEHRFGNIPLGKRSPDTFEPGLFAGQRRQDVTLENTDTEKWRQHLKDLEERRPFQDFQYWAVAPRGGKRLISISGVPVFGSDGAFKGYRGTGRDVTDQHVAFERLNQAEERLRQAFEKVTMGVIIADRDGRITAFNKAAQDIFGYTEAEATGRNVSMLANARDRARHDTYMNNYQRTGEAKVIGIGREAIGERKDGTTFPLSLGIAEMEIDGETHYVASIVDLSEEKLLEEKLRQSQKMEAVGQLVGGVAHDFNNLLGIIIGNLDLIHRKIEPESRIEKQLGRALGAAERGANLTRRLLNFSRQMPTETTVIDVNHTITELHDLIQKALTRTVTIHLDLDEQSPAAMAEKGDLEDAVTNLCINARDAMPQGGEINIATRRVTVGPDRATELEDLRPGDYVEIAVSDSGVGMPSEITGRIFEPFFSTKETGKGTGLGLAMVYGFAKRSGGLITVDSQEGKGSTFRLYLPASKTAPSPERAAPKAADDRPDHRGTEKILIVDDEQELAQLAETFLNDLGYRTLIASSTSAALEAIERDLEIDLVFTDVIMPGAMSGYELARRAQAINPRLKICLTSGFTGGLAEAHDASEPDYPLLRKPYTDQTLGAMVRTILDGAEQDAGPVA